VTVTIWFLEFLDIHMPECFLYIFRLSLCWLHCLTFAVCTGRALESW